MSRPARTRTGGVPLRGLPSAALFASLGVAVALAAAGAASSATSAPRRMTVYSLVKAEEFVNTKDDRQRGIKSNPFGNYKDLTPTTKQSHKGALPGDYDLFQFKLYDNAALDKPVGSAEFACYYGFELLAFCKATYEFDDGGTLAGAGLVDFKKPGFSIAITGGTGKYVGVRGDAESTTAAKHSQRIVFVFG
jgi:hypothetical protein